MIKLFKFILLIIMIGIVLFWTLLHTNSGKGYLSASLSRFATQGVGQRVDIAIKEIALSASHLDITAQVNGGLTAKIEGFYDPLKRSFDIDYHLFGKRIVYAKVAFDDEVDIRGSVEAREENFHLLGRGKALEGDVDFSFHYTPLKVEDIRLILTDVLASKVSLLLGEKPLLANHLSLRATIPLWSDFEKNGVVHVDLKRGGVYLHNIKDLSGLSLPDDVMLWGVMDLVLGGAKHTFKADIASTIGEVSLTNGRFIEANKKCNTNYALEIPELAAWQWLTKKRFSGAFAAKGEIEYQDALRFDGRTTSLGGEINYYYQKQHLEAGLADVSLRDLFIMMGYPPIMIGNIAGKMEYDLRHNIAIINLKSAQLKFRKTHLTQKILHATGVDFAREIFTQSYFSGGVEDGIVQYDFEAKNSKSIVRLIDTKMDAKHNTINAHFDLAMQGEELSGEIYGSLKSPQVKPDVGKYIEFKAKKEIDNFFGIGTTQKVKEKLKEIDVEDIKGYLKGLF